MNINWQEYARQLQTATTLSKTLGLATIVTFSVGMVSSYTLSTFVQTATPNLPETVLAMVRPDGMIIESEWVLANKPQAEAA